MGLCGPLRRRGPAGGGIPLRGYVEKILQDQVAMLGGDALGMELHAVHRIAAVVHPHDQVFRSFPPSLQDLAGGFCDRR